MQRLGASFRDRDGFVFAHDNTFYRRIAPSYAATYAKLKQCGFYARMQANGWLIPHREVSPGRNGWDDLVLEPEQLPLITHPFEWSFSQLQDAALLTLQIQRAALAEGYSLKDASAYNIQFLAGRPVLIDTLSFEPYAEGQSWPAYRQFCQHFLAPLALMSLRDVRLGQLLRCHLDGIPLDLASGLLPRRSWLRPGLLMHLHLHARAQSRYVNRDTKVRPRVISRSGLLGILDSLESAVRGLRWAPQGTQWADYYQNTNYVDQAAADKTATVGDWIRQCDPASVWDLGANDGTFSRLAVEHGAQTVAWDIDAAAVEKCYRHVRSHRLSNLHPALLDLTNPTPSLGWELRERQSFFERKQPDMALALALIHHLAIGNNVPLELCAQFFRRIAPTLIIEWVPKSDSKVATLLCNRADTFPDYTEASFQKAFDQHYRRLARRPVAGSERVLYLFEAGS
jgi:hypothetical protein